MERNYGYDQENTVGASCKIYVPMDPGSYSPTPSKGGYPRASCGNELVDHVFDSIDKRNSENRSPGSIDEIFEDRLTLIRSKMELILLQLAQRVRIHDEIIYRIDKDRCKSQNLLFDWGTKIYRVDKDRIHIERMNLDLEKQKRGEEASYFNDTAFLNRELRDALIQYQEEVQKTSMISEMEGAT